MSQIHSGHKATIVRSPRVISVDSFEDYEQIRGSGAKTKQVYQNLGTPLRQEPARSVTGEFGKLSRTKNRRPVQPDASGGSLKNQAVT
jgi:hypothetical protein